MPIGALHANAFVYQCTSLLCACACIQVCTGWHQTGGGREAVLLEEPLIVEPRFKEQFLIANPTRTYEDLLQVSSAP